MRTRPFAVMSSKVKDLPPYPEVHRLRVGELVLGTFWGGVFLLPFVYGQYWYKTRSGLSAIDFYRLKSPDGDPSLKTENLLASIQSSEKPGDRY